MSNYLKFIKYFAGKSWKSNLVTYITNHYKIALVIDDLGEEQDYHFYRQDSDGYWSHKPGKEEVRRVDASGKLLREIQELIIISSPLGSYL